MTSEQLKRRLRGVHNILLTPFRSDFSLDIDVLELNVNAVLAHGVHGLLVGGAYGEFPSMSTAERKLLIREAVQITGGRVPVIACTAHSSTLEALELTLDAESAGADGAMLTPPYVTEVSDSDIVRHFTFIAERAGIPLVLYNNLSTGVVMSPPLLNRLADLPHMAGLKQGVTTATDMAESVALLSDRLAVMCASDTVMDVGLSIGMTGVTSTNSSFLADIILHTYQAAMAQDWEQARRSHARWARFRRFARRVGQPAAAKAAMDLVGLRGGVCRPPLMSLDAADRESLRSILEEMGLYRFSGVEGGTA